MALYKNTAAFCVFMFTTQLRWFHFSVTSCSRTRMKGLTLKSSLTLLTYNG